MRPLWIVLLTLACAAGPSVRGDEDPLASIARLERSRSLGGGQLEAWATTAGQPEIRARALRALARLQALSTAPTVERALADPDPGVRREAAFAAGELAQAWEEVPSALRQALGDALSAAEAREGDGEAHLFELEALGKVGTPQTLEVLAQRLSSDDAKVVARAAVSLGVAGRMKRSLPASALAGFERALSRARWPATYALANAHDVRARPLLAGVLHDADPQVRAMAAKGLSDLEQDADVPSLGAALADDDGRVAAEAVRGLVKAAARCPASGPCAARDALGALPHAVGFVLTAASPRGVSPLLAFAQSPLPDSLRGLAVSVRTAIDEAAAGIAAGAKSDAAAYPSPRLDPGALRRELGRLDCRMAAAIDRIDGHLALVRTCGLDAVPLARRLALGLNALPEGPHFAERASVEALSPFLEDPDASVRLAAINALGQIHQPAAGAAVRPFLASADRVLAADAAAAAGALHDTEAIPSLVPLLDSIAQNLPEEGAPVADAVIALKATQAIPALQRWLEAPHANLRIQAARALSALTGQPVEVPVVPQSDRAFPVPELGTLLRVKTERGAFDIRLRPDLAPQTSANFTALAKKGFFRGLTFHRIVPDFVAQGGDPRGDGEGGPGYTIPCEINPLRYDRGVVGVALSGKDTGGSQLFVTTSPQPHLDGRYTAFGEVTSGIKVVDGLLEGERIEDIQVLAPPK